MTFRPWLALLVMTMGVGIAIAFVLEFVRSHGLTAVGLVVGVPTVTVFGVTVFKQRRLLHLDEWFSERPSRGSSLAWAAVGVAGVVLAGAGETARALAGSMLMGALVAGGGMLVVALKRRRHHRDTADVGWPDTGRNNY